MIARFLHTQSKSVTFSANILIFSSFISAVLGILRDRLLVSHFGAGGDTDVYLAAFRIPDLVYGIFILGGISVAFLPLFSELFEKNEKEAWAFASNLFNILFAGLALFAAVLFLMAPLLSHIITPGFSPEQKALTISLMRLMFLSPIFFGIASVLSGVVQYFDRFLAYAIAPILYNIGIVVGILFLAPRFGIWGVGLGVALGALLYFLVQLPSAIYSGLRWRPVFFLRDPSMKKVWRLAIPRLPGALGYHINLILMTALASTFSVGSITVFSLANNIQAFPINLIGVPFAIAVFPALSRAFAKKNIDQFRSAFVLAFSEIMFLALPMAVTLFLLRAQIIRLAYGAGRFGWQDTRLTAAVLGIFTLGVLFQALIPLLARTFFSIQNTKTPTIAGLFTVGFNIILALLFIRLFSFENMFSKTIAEMLHLQGIQDLRVLSLPLALMISGFFQCVVLSVLLAKKVQHMFMKEFFFAFLKLFIPTVLLGGAIYGTLQVFGMFFTLRTFGEVFLQTVFALGVGGAVFLLAAWAVKSPQLWSIIGSLKRQFYGK